MVCRVNTSSYFRIIILLIIKGIKVLGTAVPPAGDSTVVAGGGEVRMLLLIRIRIRPASQASQHRQDGRKYGSKVREGTKTVASYLCRRCQTARAAEDQILRIFQHPFLPGRGGGRAADAGGLRWQADRWSGRLR